MTNTLRLTLLLSLASFSCIGLVHAEEPFFGIGVTSQNYTENSGNDNDFTTNHTGIKFTLGSRIAKNWIIESSFQLPSSSDQVTLSGGVEYDIEFESIISASINYAIKKSIFTLYGGPNVSAAQLSIETIGGTTEQNAETLNALNARDTKISPGLGLGVDIQIYKKFSLDLHGETFYCDGLCTGDNTGYDVGIELRYHM